MEGRVPNTSGWVSHFSPSFTDQRHPRTAAAWDTRHLFLVTVDGRQSGYSRGMTFQELAEFLTGTLGVEQAINLDGGGSTTMVTGGEVVNRPSDSAGERAIGAAILVVQADTRSTFPS